MSPMSTIHPTVAFAPPCRLLRQQRPMLAFKDSEAKKNNHINSPCWDLDGSDLREDDTCYLLTLKMSGARGRDIQVTLHEDTVHISGYLRGGANSRRKRQRISRQFQIDPTIVDLERAIARVWNNGCLTLYAPKKHIRARTVSITSLSDD